MEMWMDHTGVDDRGLHRKRGRPAKGDGALGIDLTPMLDVVMIMLIFFIVAGSFVRESVVEMERKSTSSAESDGPSENITVQVSATDGFETLAVQALHSDDFSALDTYHDLTVVVENPRRQALSFEVDYLGVAALVIDEVTISKLTP